MYKISSWNIFWHKRKINNFDPYSVFLAIATNIPQRLKTAFVLQGHICWFTAQATFLINVGVFLWKPWFFFFLKILILELDGNELEVQKSIY